VKQAMDRYGHRQRFAVGAILALLAALPYLVAGTGGFLELDDLKYVVENPMVREGLSWAGVRWSLAGFHAGNWHPITWISHMIDATLFGMNAAGHHLVSVLIHALGTALLFLVLARLTGNTGRSAFVAALFGMHPLHVESVAWVAQRKDVLSGLFFMLVLLAYERHVRRGGRWPYPAALACFALGLAAKPTVVTIPLVLLLLDFWPLGRIRRRSADGARPGVPPRVLLEKIPFLLLSCASAAITFLAQHAGAAVRNIDDLPLGARFANALVAYATYLGRALWPAKLALYYPHPLTSIPWWNIVLAGLLVAGISFAAVRAVRRRPYLSCGWLWFVGMLVPMIGIVQVGDQASADRYTYLPLIGLSIMTAWLLPDLLVGRPRRRTAPGVVGVALLAVFAVRSHEQLGLWRNGERLFRHTLAVTSGNWVIHNSLGFMLARQGRLEEAIAQYRASLDLRPDRVETLINLGSALARSGRPAQAADQLRLALRRNPASAMAHYDLGLLLSQQKLVPREDVIGHYRESLRLDPGYARAHNNLANELAESGLREEAIAHYREALRLQPGFKEARKNLALILADPAVSPVFPKRR